MILAVSEAIYAIAEKKPVFNVTRTHDLNDVGVTLYQLSYEANYAEYVLTFQFSRPFLPSYGLRMPYLNFSRLQVDFEPPV